MIATKKVYCIDTGIINSIAFSSSDNYGKTMENIVAVELLRRKSLKGYDIFYWKDSLQRQVDFLIKQEERVIQLIQVTYISSKEGLSGREIKSLLAGSSDLHCSNLLVITWITKRRKRQTAKQ